MRRISNIWKANAIAFIGSFCVMVIELIAARILAPYIGVSLFTWTSIIGVILAGIALGNYLGGKIADRYPSPLLLAVIFFAGSFFTIAILPAVGMVTAADWFGHLSVMLNFVLKTSCIFLLPAITLSMVSPMVIKLTLANLGRTGGVVGTIYACSTAGSILGTFMTGFYFILWFGTSMIVWLVAAVLAVTGILSWFFWKVPGRWSLSWKNFIIGIMALEGGLIGIFSFPIREPGSEHYIKESNYYTIKILPADRNVKVLILDNMIQGYANPQSPIHLEYGYVKVFEEIIRYTAMKNASPAVLHLGGGTYSFPRYMEAVYPNSINEVVEIDPTVTQVAQEKLGLPPHTEIKTFNKDARLFLIQRKAKEKYDIVIGDVFNDRSTPYHLTTLEFNRLAKSHMKADGIYLVNILDDYKHGRYMASFVQTLRQTFEYVYLFSSGVGWDEVVPNTFILVATDCRIDLYKYQRVVTENGKRELIGNPHNEIELERYLSERSPILLTDDYVPTDILVASFAYQRAE